jgi:hypothetical protein
VNAILQYPDFNLTFEASLTGGTGEQSADLVFVGAGGPLHIFRHGHRFIPASGGAPRVLEAGRSGVRYHLRKWLDCVRSRLRPNADVVVGCYAFMACYLANLAYRDKD